jgi:hypothetical protein
MVNCFFVSPFLAAKLIIASEFYRSRTIDPEACPAEPF